MNKYSCIGCKYNKHLETTQMPADSILMNKIYICNNEKSSSYRERMGVLTNLMTMEVLDSRNGRSCDKKEEEK